ncbi:MAG: histidinol-phosphatase HisJ family protein [Oscillospiraceae bacterium]|jgi:histidinol-phosphatase (PHP family)|nr:histidinol-phosphatase HisJ family protein [Oscillospiraceae bacterium]
MIKADFHTHSEFSVDSRMTLSEMAERAMELGLEVLCVTDHYELGQCDDLGAEELFDVPRYFDALREVKERYMGKIDIRFGVELGLVKSSKEELHNFVAANNFDFIIGSSHSSNGKKLSNLEFFEGRSEQTAFLECFQSILENVKNLDCYSVYGHLDYVARYGPTKGRNFRIADYHEVLESILRIIIGNGHGIEVNTSGFHYGLGNPHPHKDILALYKELGGEIITVGSDAHTPKRIGADFGRVADLLKSLGFRYYSTFKDKEPMFHNL